MENIQNTHMSVQWHVTNPKNSSENSIDRYSHWQTLHRTLWTQVSL